jgi:hypothetical protein
MNTAIAAHVQSALLRGSCGTSGMGLRTKHVDKFINRRLLETRSIFEQRDDALTTL